MADVDTAARDHFCNTFCAATENIAEGLSKGRACTADWHWTKWANFCSRVALNPILIGYKDPVPILNIFAWDYRTGNITPTSSTVRSYDSKRSTRDTTVISPETTLSVGLTMISQTCRPTRLHCLTTNCLLF